MSKYFISYHFNLYTLLFETLFKSKIYFILIKLIYFYPVNVWSYYSNIVITYIGLCLHLCKKYKFYVNNFVNVQHSEY